MLLCIKCSCNAQFQINSNCVKTSGDIKCPSCGRSLPGKASERARDVFVAYSSFCEELNKKELYECKID